MKPDTVNGVETDAISLFYTPNMVLGVMSQSAIDFERWGNRDFSYIVISLLIPKMSSIVTAKQLLIWGWVEFTSNLKMGNIGMFYKDVGIVVKKLQA